MVDEAMPEFVERLGLPIPQFFYAATLHGSEPSEVDGAFGSGNGDGVQVGTYYIYLLSRKPK